MMNGNINNALILLDRALEEIETGFVPCASCGGQDDTQNLDFFDDLKMGRSYVLEASRNT